MHGLQHELERVCVVADTYIIAVDFFLLLFFKIRIDAARTVGRTLLSSEVYYTLHTACSSNRELPLVLETVQQGQILAKFILCSLIKVAYNYYCCCRAVCMGITALITLQ